MVSVKISKLESSWVALLTDAVEKFNSEFPTLNWDVDISLNARYSRIGEVFEPYGTIDVNKRLLQFNSEESYTHFCLIYS